MVYHMVKPYQKTVVQPCIFRMVQPYGQPWLTMIYHTILPLLTTWSNHTQKYFWKCLLTYLLTYRVQGV